MPLNNIFKSNYKTRLFYVSMCHMVNFQAGQVCPDTPFLLFLPLSALKILKRYTWFKVSPLWKGKINKFFPKTAVVSEIPCQVPKPKKQECIPCAPLPLGLMKSCPCVKKFCICRPLGYCDCLSQEGTLKLVHPLR